MANPEVGSLHGIVDLDRYAIHHPHEPACKQLTVQVRHDLASNGAVTLPGFILPDALEQIAGDIRAAEPYVPIRRQQATVYHRDSDATSGDDPRHHLLEWFAGHVTRDMIPPYAGAHCLYVSGLMKTFIAACVGQSRVFEYADPLAGLVATILPPQGQYPWHYDTNEFVVTIMTQQPQGGGTFEYCQNLRQPGDENLDGLNAVVTGSDRSMVRTIDMQPGDLQLFLGRYSLHQVTPVTGDLARHVLVLSYADRPGVIGPVDRTRSVYGRVTEAHLVAEQVTLATSDGLIL